MIRRAYFLTFREISANNEQWGKNAVPSDSFHFDSLSATLVPNFTYLGYTLVRENTKKKLNIFLFFFFFFFFLLYISSIHEFTLLFENRTVCLLWGMEFFFNLYRDGDTAVMTYQFRSIFFTLIIARYFLCVTLNKKKFQL